MPIAETTAALIGAGISAAGGVASSAAGNIRSQKKWQKRQDYLEKQQIAAEQRQFDYNKDLQDYAYSKNLEQWNRENAYNTPAAQMERYRNAGLNPNLIYSDGGAMAAANSPTMQVGDVGSGSAQVAPYSADSFGGAFDYVGAASLAIQRKLADAEIANKNADTLGKLTDNDFKSASLDLRVDEIRQNIAKTIGETENLAADTQGKEIANETAIELQPTVIEQAKEDLENTKRQGLNLEKTSKLIDAQISKIGFENQLLKVQKKIADLDEKIKKIDADNADVLMDLRKQREAAAIRFVNTQSSHLDKQIGSYDTELQAKLALSAAETLNRTSFAGLADARKDFQAFQNKINEILLDPTKKTDAKTYFSALVLKNMSETSFLDVMKYVTDVVSDSPTTAPSEIKQSAPSEKKGDGNNDTLGELFGKFSEEQAAKYNSWRLWYEKAYEKPPTEEEMRDKAYEILK